MTVKPQFENGQWVVPISAEYAIQTTCIENKKQEAIRHIGHFIKVNTTQWDYDYQEYSYRCSKSWYLESELVSKEDYVLMTKARTLSGERIAALL